MNNAITRVVWHVGIAGCTLRDQSFRFGEGTWAPLPDREFKLESGSDLPLTSHYAVTLPKGDLMVRLAAPAFLMAHSEMGEIQPESIKLPIGVQLRIPASQSITLKPDGSDTSIKAGILIIWPTSNSSAGPRADHEVQSLSGKTLLLLPDGGNMALTHGATSLRFAETTD